MSSLISSLQLVDLSGAAIIVVITVLLLLGMVTTFTARARYGAMVKDIRADPAPDTGYRFQVLNRASADLERELSRLPRGGRVESINVQGIVEHAMQLELRGLLMGERLIKANAGLLITLGLTGTFYGLTRSIGKLVHLVSSDFSLQADVAEPLTRGLTDALGGMSVAFTTSLAGILAAILVTLLGVFANVAERRAGFTIALELRLDRRVAEWEAEQPSLGAEATLLATERFDKAVHALETTIGRFEGALARFADNSREFHEFNAHLKDNIQRMSLSFADVAGALRTHAAEGSAGR
jgi:hypothetical protein